MSDVKTLRASNILFQGTKKKKKKRPFVPYFFFFFFSFPSFAGIETASLSRVVDLQYSLVPITPILYCMHQIKNVCINTYFRFFHLFIKRVWNNKGMEKRISADFPPLLGWAFIYLLKYIRLVYDFVFVSVNLLCYF